jgi:hypothetical protein
VGGEGRWGEQGGEMKGREEKEMLEGKRGREERMGRKERKGGEDGSGKLPAHAAARPIATCCGKGCVCVRARGVEGTCVGGCGPPVPSHLPHP